MLNPRIIRPLVAIGIICVALSVYLGCEAARRHGSHAVASFVDCMKPNVRAVAGELTGVVTDVIENATDNTGRVNWSSVKASLGTFKSDAPLCAFQTAVKEMLLAAKNRDPNAPQSAGLQYSEDDLRAGYATINAEVFGARLAPL